MPWSLTTNHLIQSSYITHAYKSISRIFTNYKAHLTPTGETFILDDFLHDKNQSIGAPWTEMEAAPIVTELLDHWLTSKGFMSPKQLVEHGDNHCGHSELLALI